ncbi:MAG TPA: hypothetical protein VMS65_14910, partial [Polyangiaceae bacterium]|nr:hypothetical protein [Polyangiaceae bacterium]
LLPLDTTITDGGGRPIARFGGPETALVVSGLSTVTPFRARIETGIGQGGFRVRGFVDARKLPIATTENVAVVPGHVWIGARRAVTVVGVTPDKLRIEKKLTTPLEQTFTAFTSCQKLVLGTPAPPGWSPPGDARGYVLRAGSLDLRDAPRGNVVTTLYKAGAVPGVLFFGSEGAGGWVRVAYHGEVVVDAWVSSPDVQALPSGETMDQLVTPSSVRNQARLVVPGAPRVVKAPREIALRAAANGEPIGVIEAGADTYVIDVVAGWASVLPRALDVMPAPNAQFWVKKEELGL